MSDEWRVGQVVKLSPDGEWLYRNFWPESPVLGHMGVIIGLEPRRQLIVVAFPCGVTKALHESFLDEVKS